MTQIVFIPSAIPPHRGAPGASAEQRLALLQLAVEPMEKCSIDQRELNRPGPSYMFDTLTELRSEHPEQPMALILGMDAFQGLTSWHRWQGLIGLAHMVVIDRPGYRPEFPEALAPWVEQHQTDDLSELHQRASGSLFFCSIPFLEISASQIRHIIQTGRDPSHLLPHPVQLSIQQQGLYQHNSHTE